MMIMMPTLSFQQHSGNVHPSWLRMTESARGHKKTFAIHICMSWKSLHFSTKSCPIYHLHWLRSSVMNGHGCGLWSRFKWRRLCPKMILNCGRPWITLGPRAWVTDPLAHVERVNTCFFRWETPHSLPCLANVGQTFICIFACFTKYLHISRLPCWEILIFAQIARLAMPVISFLESWRIRNKDPRIRGIQNPEILGPVMIKMVMMMIWWWWW